MTAESFMEKYRPALDLWCELSKLPRFADWRFNSEMSRWEIPLPGSSEPWCWVTQSAAEALRESLERDPCGEHHSAGNIGSESKGVKP